MDYNHCSKRAVGISRKEDLRIYDIPEQRNSLCIRTVQNTRDTLVVLELERCNLLDFNFVLNCPQLRYCSLSNNLIATVPLIDSLKSLQFLILTSNKLETTQHIANLKSSPPTLLYLSLKGNPVSSISSYRPFVVKIFLKSQCRLKCLDSHIISDKEWLVALNNSGRKFQKLSLPYSHTLPESFFELPATLETARAFHTTKNQLDRRVRLLTCLANTLSPVRRLQEKIRFTIRNRSAVKVMQLLPTLQANIRRKLLQSHLERELFHILSHYNCTHLFPATQISEVGRNQAAMNTMVKFVRKVILTTRKSLAARRILQCIRRFLVRCKYRLTWLQHRKVSGIVFPARMLPRVQDCLDKLSRTAVTAGLAKTQEATGQRALRFSFETSPAKRSEDSDLSAKVVPFLKLFSVRDGHRDPLSSVVLWNSEPVAFSRQGKRHHKGEFTLSTLRNKPTTIISEESRPASSRNRSTKMMMLSQKIQSLKESKSSRKQGVHEDADDQPLDDEQGFPESPHAPAPPLAAFARRQVIRKPIGILGVLRNHCSTAERRVVKLIKPRGRQLLFQERADIQQLLAADSDHSHFQSTGEAMMVVRCLNYRVLSRLFTLITNHGTKQDQRAFGYYDVYFDSILCESVAATSIQRFVRGCAVRTRLVPSYTKNLIRGRAVIAIQRCWRLHAGLQRRLQLLARINTCCKSIFSQTLYLDLWVFYSLIRQQYNSVLPATMTLYPEFRGAPSVNNAGNCIFCNLEADRMHEMASIAWSSDDLLNTPAVDDGVMSLPDGSTVTHSNSFLFVDILKELFNDDLGVRFGVPLWAPWRPIRTANDPADSKHLPFNAKDDRKSRGLTVVDTDREDTLYARSNKEYPLFHLLTKNVEIGVEDVLPFYSPEQRKHLTEKYSADIVQQPLRVMRLQFSSLGEAKCRAAMVMLATFEPHSRKSVELMTTSSLLDRIKSNSSQIIRQLTNYHECLQHLQASQPALALEQNESPAKARIGDSARDAIHPKPLPFIHNLWETRILLAEAPDSFRIKDLAVSDVIRMRLLLDYIALLPERIDLPDLAQSASCCDLESNTSKIVEEDCSNMVGTASASVASSNSDRLDKESTLQETSTTQKSASQSAANKFESKTERTDDSQSKSYYYANSGSHSSDSPRVSISLPSHCSESPRVCSAVSSSRIEEKDSIASSAQSSLADMDDVLTEEQHVASVRIVRTLAPSEWVDGKEMFSKLTVLIRRCSTKYDPILGEVKDLYLMNLWSRAMLLHWCSRNTEKTDSEIQHHSGKTSSKSDKESKLVSRSYSEYLASRKTSPASEEAFDKRELLSRGRKHMNLVKKQGIKTTSQKSRSVLHECLIPLPGRQTRSMKSQTTNFESQPELPPSGAVVDVDADLARTAYMQACELIKTDLTEQKSKPPTIKDNYQVGRDARTAELPPSSAPAAFNHDVYNMKPSTVHMMLRASTARDKAIQEKIELTHKAQTLEEIKVKEIQEIQARVKVEKLEHELTLQRHEQAVRGGSSLSSLASKVEASFRGQLKANRLQFLIDRVQRIRAGESPTSAGKASKFDRPTTCKDDIAVKEKSLSATPKPPSHGHTQRRASLQLRCRPGSAMQPAESPLMVQSLTPVPNQFRPSTTATGSRRHRPFSALLHSDIDQFNPTTSSDAVLEAEPPASPVVGFSPRSHIDGTALIAASTPSPSPSCLNGDAMRWDNGRRQSLMTMDSSYRRQSILTINTIEIPSLDPRANYTLVERLDSANDASSAEIIQFSDSSLSMEPSASIAMSLGPPLFTSPPTPLTPIRPGKNMEKYFPWSRSHSFQEPTSSRDLLNIGDES